MKVVLFCGGLGTRLRDYSESIPKPLVPVGYRPILWHVMRYYAHFGHKDFILCLGYKADSFRRQDAVASFAGVAPTQSFHLVSVEDGGRVKTIQHVKDVGMRINGGFFVFRKQIFDWMRPGEELVQEPFQRLAAAGKLLAYLHDGFWACMDTFKDKQLLEDLYSHGQVPWEVWKSPAAPPKVDAKR